MKDFSETSNFELNCLLAIELSNDEKWVNRHSDLVPDYCEDGKMRNCVISTLERIESVKDEARSRYNCNDWEGA